MLQFVSGLATTSPSREGRDRPEIVVSLETAFDPVSLARIKHTSTCSWCRRLWTTLQFQHSLAADHVWSGVVAEFLKLLASSGVQSKY